MAIKQINVYVASDSSGSTAIAVTDATFSQFEQVKIIKYIWPMLRDTKQIDDMISDILKKPGIIIYTMVDKKKRSYMKELCKRHDIYCISAIARVVQEISTCLQIPPSIDTPGSKYAHLDESYFSRIEAIGFAINHDDGKGQHDLKNSDILILGVSRTSKTPISLYLAQRGYRVSNIPIVPGIKMPSDLDSLKNTLIVGLSISPQRLGQIRESRMLAYTKEEKMKISQYTDITTIKDEINTANQIFSQYKLPVIDVTRKAVEESAAQIINLLFEKRSTHTPIR